MSARKLTKAGINLKTAASTKIGRTAGLFIPHLLVVRCTAASAITVAAQLSVGTNSSSYDDIKAITTLTGVTSAGKVITYALSTSAVDAVPAGTDIYVKVTTAATGTSEVAEISIIPV